MVQVYASSVIDASADNVWSRIRDFNGMPQWHPLIADSRIENNQPSDRVGCIRHFHLRDGGMVREKLLALSDYEYSCSYEILESPMGVEHYVATLKLTPVTDGARCFAEWSAEFECAFGRERELTDSIGGEVFQGGFDALKRHFGGPLMLQRVVRSTIIDAPIARVWAVLRDFNSHNQWHDVVEASRIEGDERSDQVGCVRSFTLKDGNRIREQLLTLSDTEHKSTYCIVEATVPLQRYVATVTLKPVTDGNRTFWHWESTFAAPPGMERELHDMVAKGVYEAGFANLRRHLRQGSDLRARGNASSMASALAIATRRIAVHRYGGAEVLQSEATEAAAPAEDEVRIQQRAIGVNFLDVYLRRGWIPSMLPLPGVLGMEAAGTVIDVGPNVNGLLPGDRLAYLGPVPGAYCGVRSVPADWVVRLPAAVEDDVAAALLLKGITADYLLRDLGHVGRGTRLLVHAAAGGVGLLVCAWARRLGAVVLGTVSSDAKARVAREHGCEHVIVTSDYRFADAVQRACGGADVVIDGLGDAAREENLAALARRGHWISLGQASGPLSPLPPDALVAKSLSFSRPVVFDYTTEPGQLAERAQRVWNALADGTIKAPPIERHALAAAAQAHARLESRSSIGALILTT